MDKMKRPLYVEAVITKCGAITTNMDGTEEMVWLEKVDTDADGVGIRRERIHMTGGEWTHSHASGYDCASTWGSRHNERAAHTAQHDRR